jgi:ornithine cyclodeaminase/alanine dehydrogenase-like protein (mu-crystallin family)
VSIRKRSVPQARFVSEGRTRFAAEGDARLTMPLRFVRGCKALKREFLRKSPNAVVRSPGRLFGPAAETELVGVKVLFVNEALVHELLPMRSCIDLMRTALTSYARGEAVQPLRSLLRLPDGTGVLGLMPGYLGEPQAFGVKVVSVMPGNRGTAYESHQGVVMLFGVTHGEPLAILDATAITAIRTAAASGVATDVLAVREAGDLALIGCGTQASTHLAAVAAVRRLRRVRVWSRTRANAEAFSRREAARVSCAIEVMATAEEAVRNADLICTVTSAREPVLRGAWLALGAHVNAVGACFATHRELDGEAVRRARLFTDSRESCLNESGDFRIALREGDIEDGHLLGEVGDVVLERVPGRISSGDITVFKSLGIAIEDLASAHAIHQRALATGMGVWLDWGQGPAL